MAYRILIFLIFTCTVNYLQAQTSCCPYISKIVIIPENPTIADEIKIVTQTTTPNIGLRIFYNSFKKADTFKLVGCFYNSYSTSPETFDDTTVIGPLNEGDYFISYTGKVSRSSEFCTAYDSNIVTANFKVTKPVGISESALASKYFSVYPNPVHNLFTVEAPDKNEVFEVEIFNNLGQSFSSHLCTEKTTIDLSNFENGIYIIAIKNRYNIFYRKIIKQ